MQLTGGRCVAGGYARPVNPASPSYIKPVASRASVELELPGGEAPADALAEETEATSEVTTDESDVAVDAAPEDAEDAASPSLVASADDEEPRTLL